MLSAPVGMLAFDRCGDPTVATVCDYNLGNLILSGTEIVSIVLLGAVLIGLSQVVKRGHQGWPIPLAGTLAFVVLYFAYESLIKTATHFPG